MSIRTRSKDRCPRCYIRRVLCVCALAPQFLNKTKIIVLLHSRESKRPTNTGRLLTLSLSNCEVRIRGERGAPMDSAGLVTDDQETLLFYPSDRAVELSTDFLEGISKPITLIVPDGSWRQASKVMNRVEVLKNVRHVKLPKGPIPRLRLRKETKTGGLATFEAVARALGCIENREMQDDLEKFYKVLVERTLWSRARLLLKDCETEIPSSALNC